MNSIDRSKPVRIKPYFSIVAHSPNCIELRSGIWNPTSFTLHDENQEGYLLNLITHLDGILTLTEIANQQHIAMEDIETLVSHLEELNVIENSASNAFDWALEQTKATAPSIAIKPQLLFIGDQGLCQLIMNCSDQAVEMQYLSPAHELYAILNDPQDKWLQDGLAFQEIVAKFSAWKNHLIVLAQKEVNPLFCSKLNKILFELNIPWIHAAVDGPLLLVGPTFRSTSACYDCFETRIRMNIREHANYQKYKLALAQGKVKAATDFNIELTLQHVLASHIALEVNNMIRTQCSFTVSKVLSIYIPTMEMTFSDVLKVASCPTCGSHPLRDSSQLYFDVQTLVQD